jgi:hypothetical protein
MKTPKMSKEQKTYAVAKANYQALLEEYVRRTAHIDWNADKEAALLEDERISDEINTYGAFEALRTAEKAMVTWALNRVKKLPEYKAYAKELKGIDASAYKHPKLWDKLVNLAFRLA